MSGIKSMLSGLDGQISSKRTITFVAFICVVIAFLTNVFMSIHLEEHIFDGMLYLVMSGMGFSSFEKFSPAHAHKQINSPKSKDNE